MTPRNKVKPSTPRTAIVQRDTAETRIAIKLTIEGGGSVAQQVKLLDLLSICVHLRGAPCPSTTTVLSLNPNGSASPSH